MINKLIKIKTETELQELGSLQEILDSINELTQPIKIEATSYSDLFKIVEVLKSKWVDFINTPFVSKKEEFNFYLTQLEGKQRNRLLGITDALYEDKALAKKWYHNISKYVHPDINSEKNDTAFKVLKELYNNMIDELEDETDDK